MSPSSSIALRERLQHSLARAAGGALQLPVLPDTATRVMGMCSDEACDARELSQLVERDQSLTGHVLRVANSAAYAPNEPIVSLRQAVARLGLATLCEISMGVAMRGQVFTSARFADLARRLWAHSAAAGAYAKEIARATRRNVEGAFLCGLMHDVGKPVVLKLFVDVCQEARVEPDAEVVAETLDLFHTDVGVLLARSWKLAPWIAAAIEHHHEPSRAKEHRTETTITCLADHFSHWALGTRELSERDLAALPAVSELDLYPDDVARLTAARDRVVAQSEAFA